LRRLLAVHNNGACGSPRVEGSTKLRRSSSSVASLTVSGLRPPPRRRTRSARSSRRPAIRQARARGATGQSKIAAITVFRRPAPRRLFLGRATFLPLLVDTLSIFLVVALPPSKDLFPVRLVPPRIISTALFTALLALAFVIGNTMLAVLGAPCLEIGAAALPLLRCQRLPTHPVAFGCSRCSSRQRL
jgi:hypothetical protein